MDSSTALANVNTHFNHDLFSDILKLFHTKYPRYFSFRPTISLSFLSKLVGFSSTALCKDFICKEFSLPETSLEPIEKIDTKVVWNLMCSQSS